MVSNEFTMKYTPKIKELSIPMNNAILKIMVSQYL